MVGRLGYRWARDQDGGWRSAGSFRVTANPSDRVELRIEPELERRLETAQYVHATDRSFSYRSLLGNAVLRWEWRRGSTLYLVWQQRRIDSLQGRGPDGRRGRVGDFDLRRDAGDMLGTRPDNIFVVKLNYWLNP